MVRTPNPLVERMAFFWHRHFANTRKGVSPAALARPRPPLPPLRGPRHEAHGRLQEPGLDVSTDPGDAEHLTGESNVAGTPNENYARELMELFALGPVNDAGQPNYSENDVKQLAKALTGWQVDDARPERRLELLHDRSLVLGPEGALRQVRQLEAPDIVELVLGQPNHPTFLVRKLWGEFIPTPPDAGDAAGTSRRPTRRAGMQIKPLLQKILTHPACSPRSTSRTC